MPQSNFTPLDGTLSIEYENLLSLARIFQDSGVGVLQQKTVDGFTLKIDRFQLDTNKSDKPADAQSAMSDFLRQSLSSQMMQRLERGLL